MSGQKREASIRKRDRFLFEMRFMKTRFANVENVDRNRIRFRRSAFARILVLAAVLCVGSSTAFAIDISDYKWGFNGKVAAHRFNLLSVLITNPTPQQYSGKVVLRKSLGAGPVDAAIVENVTVSPNSSKWVQFYPYIASDIGGGVVNENWSVRYQGGSYDLPLPRMAKYQRIILDDPNTVTSKVGGALKFRLPDNLFPPFVTATDALQLVVLDHVPRWEEARRQAFLDWLYLGGTVVVLHESSGKYPDFSGPMAVLKSPLEMQGYGSGRVIQMAKNRSQFTEDDLRVVCSALPKNYQPPNAAEKTDDIVDRVDEAQQLTQAQNVYGYSEGSDPFRSTSFLGQLKQMTKPEHNWVLLHSMFWVYIALVFPGCYFLGKRWSDFRVVYAGLLGTVTLFSLLFSYVGQRGYGEASAVHTVAVARMLPDGFADVASWSNVFVTSGADYEIRHNAIGSLYSTCNEHEQVKGEINNGAEAVFRVDIPPFSNRELAARTKIPFNEVKIDIESIKAPDGRISELVLNVSGVQQADVEKQFVLSGNTFYGLSWKDGKLVLASEMGNAVGVMRVNEQRNTHYNYSYPSYDQNKVTPNERYTQMFLPLLSRSMNVSRERDAESLNVPLNAIRVFLYMKMPNEFAVQNNKLGKQEGRVLLCVTLSGTDLKQP